MTWKLSVGNQDFDNVIENDNFYIDKTKFIEEWWSSNDRVTLITRPRRFGKTLMMSTVNCFFSDRYAGRKDLFDGLCISQNRKMMDLQGAYPVVFLSFSDCKNEENVIGMPLKGYSDMVKEIKRKISQLYKQFPEILESDEVSEEEKNKFLRIREFKDEEQFTTGMMNHSIQFLCELLCRISGKKPIVILDEYDTPLQEAYSSGYWKLLIQTMRSFFNKSFKTTRFLEKALITGITRVSKESLFSDVNNFNSYSVTSEQYADCFGFTEKEVFDALDEYGMPDQKQKVKNWYDGFVFGSRKEIYNPFSIASFLHEKLFKTYWADTASYALVSELIRNGGFEARDDFLQLMKGEKIKRVINENIVYGTLDNQAGAIWSLLLCSGYLKADEVQWDDENGESLDKPVYTLSITNRETRIMFKDMVSDWFTDRGDTTAYNPFIAALLNYDIPGLNDSLNTMSLQSFSYFDTANKTPVAFWQGVLIGLAISLGGKYRITSNRTAGYGIYDLQLKPRDKSMQAFVIEVKSIDTTKKTRLKEETQLKRAVKEALKQIEDKKYYAELVAEGYPLIRKLGIAFRDQKCLVGDAESTGRTNRNVHR